MIWAVIAAPLKRALAWLLGIAGIWTLAKRDARQKAKLRAARDQIRTMERMRDEIDDLPDADDALRRWLRERGTR